MDERLKLRRQYHVHKDKRKHESQNEVVAGAAEFFRTTSKAAGISGLHLFLLHILVHFADYSRLRAARFDITHQGHLALPVQAIDCRWSSSRFDVHQIVETDPANLRRRN